MFRNFANLAIGNGTRCFATSTQAKTGTPAAKPIRKAAVSAYNLYVKEQLEQHREANEASKDLLKKSAGQWKMLDAAKKEVYAQRARELTEERRRAQENMSPAEREEALNKKHEKAERQFKKQVREEREKSGYPKHPGGPYALFVKDVAAEAHKEGQKGDFATYKAKWAELKPADKKKYTKLAAEEYAKYTAKMKEWKEKSHEPSASSASN
ncbi:unnamed protein product, partial [Mesorhabditis spiculigera]